MAGDHFIISFVTVYMKTIYYTRLKQTPGIESLVDPLLAEKKPASYDATKKHARGCCATTHCDCATVFMLIFVVSCKVVHFPLSNPVLMLGQISPNLM